MEKHPGKPGRYTKVLDWASEDASSSETRGRLVRPLGRAGLLSEWPRRRVHCGTIVRDGIFQDWAVNRSVGFKSRLVLAFFRLAQTVGGWPPALAPLKVPVILAYRILTEWILSIDLSWNTSVGPRLRLYHGHALVVHPASVIGADCILRHSTTLGTRDYPERATDDAPVLGDGVDVGAHVVILGPIRVGDRVAIGAGSVVVSDVPDDSVVVGNPARVIGLNEHPVIPAPARQAVRDAEKAEA